jgi:hypothetical protein
MCHEDASPDANLMKTVLVLLGYLIPQQNFCKRNFRTPAWVDNVISLHGSYLGQAPWVFPLGEFLSPRVFYPQVVDRALGPDRLPLSFSLHTCNNFLQSGERRSNGLIFFGGLCLGIL